MNKIENVYWRALVNYYETSIGMIKIDGRISGEFKIEDGSKEAEAIEAYIKSKNTGHADGEHDMDHSELQAFEDLRRLSGLPQLVEAKKKGDGNLANNAKPYDKVTQGDVVAGRLGKDEKGGKATKEGTELDDIKALSGIKEAKGKCCCETKGEDKCPVHGKVEEAKEEKKCNHTPKGKKCPVHGVNECMGK
jgi:hypothetical protein